MKVILTEVTLPVDLDLIKSKLKRDGIPFEVKNEMTLNTAGAYAMGNNGAEILVEDSNLEVAQDALREIGKLPQKGQEINPEFGFLAPFQKVTDKIPFLKGQGPVAGLFAIVLFLGLIAIVLTAIFF